MLAHNATTKRISVRRSSNTWDKRMVAHLNIIHQLWVVLKFNNYNYKVEKKVKKLWWYFRFRAFVISSRIFILFGLIRVFFLTRMNPSMSVEWWLLTKSVINVKIITSINVKSLITFYTNRFIQISQLTEMWGKGEKIQNYNNSPLKMYYNLKLTWPLPYQMNSDK